MKLRSLLSAIIAASVVFSSVFTCSAAEENLVTDNFESYSQYASEGVWTTKNPIIIEPDGNKAAAFGAGTGLTGLYHTNSGFSADVTGIIANFSIKFTGDVKQHVIFGASNSKDPTGQPNRVLQFYSGGARLQLCANAIYNIYYSYTVDKWYDVSIRLNYNTGYYELLIKDGANEFRWSKTVPDLMRTDAQKSAITYYVFWMDKIANQQALVDNFRIFGTTDNRIYPAVSEAEEFVGYESTDGKTLPSGFDSDSELGADNGFFTADSAVNMISAEGKSLSLQKSLASEITPANVSISLSEATKASYNITLADSSGKSEILSVSPDMLSLGAQTADFVSNGTETVSVTSKDGILRVAVYNEENFAVLEIPTELSAIKSFAISSDADDETDITIDSVNWGTSTFFEMETDSISGAPITPGTDKITLTFSNNIIPSAGAGFMVDGVAAEDVVYSENKAVITLPFALEPSKEYVFSYSDVYDAEGYSVSGEIPFKTDVRIACDVFDITADQNGYTLNADLRANVEEVIPAVIILTVYDNTTGKIVAFDFKNIEINPLDQSFSVSVSKPESDNYTVEAYVWDSFENMNTLGYTNVLGGAQ